MTGNGDDWLSLPKHIAEKWIDNLAAHWEAVYERGRKRRAEKQRKLKLFPEREAYLRRVGYARMSREWWAERRAAQDYAPDVAERRDVDNQILAKYQRRKDEFPGGEEVPAPAPVPEKPDAQVSSGPSDTRSVQLALTPMRNPPFQGVDITKTLTPHGLAKLVVIHRRPRMLRVFWHDGHARATYEVEGVSVPLTERRGGRYWEGTPSAEQWALLGVSTA